MSRMKSIFASLLFAMFGGIVPLANAKPVVVQLTISGSSAMWQSLALAAYQEAGAGAGHALRCRGGRLSQ